MALPQVHRLRNRRDFTAIYQKGLRRSSPDLTLRALRPRVTSTQPSTPLQPTQFGFSISLKVSKKAVIRNLIRRRISAALQSLLPRFPPGWRVVIVVQPSATQCNYGQILQQLEQLLAEVFHGHK